MIIGGLEKFSLLDFPGHLSAIIFTKGCNFRCQFCYNPMLVLPDRPDKLNHKQEKSYSQIDEDNFFHFLRSRVGKLEAVVVTGGEPTLHADLSGFIKKIKDLGFKVKLDTNGTNPVMLKILIKRKLIDYIAMDIKASPAKYEKTIGIKFNLNKIKKSIKIIIESKLPYEFRTTLTPGLIDEKDIVAIGRLIQGAAKWFLQQLKTDTEIINNDLKNIKPFSDKELESMRQIGKQYVKECRVR